MDYDKLEQTCYEVLRVGWKGINPKDVLNVIRVARERENLRIDLEVASNRAKAAEAQRLVLTAEVAELREAVKIVAEVWAGWSKLRAVKRALEES